MLKRPPALPSATLHHFSVSVPNIEEAIAWYADTLGFKTENRFAIESLSAQAAFMVRDSLRIELWQIGAGASVPDARKEPNTDLKSGGTKHVAFLVPDLQVCLRELIHRGVDVAAIQRHPSLPMAQDPDPLDPAKGTAFAAFIRDPAGTLIELLDRDQVRDLPNPGL
jgi:methylmalonyl-CoA/ethylmalonyl-CoA epimerase